MSVYQTFQHARNQIAFTAPHFSAAQAGISLLEQGATAIEATIASAASLGVVYPHMTGLGADAFWIISEPGKSPVVIDASGKSCYNATPSLYSGYTSIPSKGGLSAITMAGAVAGWQKALELNQLWGGNVPLNAIFNHAIGQARWGFEVSASLANATQKIHTSHNVGDAPAELKTIHSPLLKGDILKQPLIATTLEQLCSDGLDSFYSGDIGSSLCKTLNAAGSPIGNFDFVNNSAQIQQPISANLNKGKVFNVGAPTQGIATLIIMSIYDRLKDSVKCEADFIHLIVEATKQAFIIRNTYLCDPSFSDFNIEQYLSKKSIDKLSQAIDMNKTMPWELDDEPADTVWTGCIDNQGRMVSYIQSLYWEFGSTIECPETGVIWNNRGHSFSLSPNSPNKLAPGKKPLHTLNPGYAELNNGSRICFGSMGGDGQPQILSAIFLRYLYHGMALQKAVNKGRWLLGRNWGEHRSGLAIESDINETTRLDLITRGHDLNVVEACNELMGHAGMVELNNQMQTDACFDPRSDGRAFSSMGTL